MRVTTDELERSMAAKSRDELQAILSNDTYTVEAHAAAEAELARRPAREEIAPELPVAGDSSRKQLVGKIIAFLVLMGMLRSLLRLVHRYLFQ